MPTRNPFSSKRKKVERQEEEYCQKLLLWHESSEGKQVMKKLEQEFMPFALQHSHYLRARGGIGYSTFTGHPFYTERYIMLETLKSDPSDEDAARAVRSMRAAFTHMVGDFTLAGALEQIAEFEQQINDGVKHRQSIVQDAAYFHEVRVGARRMELLTEAFRKNLDGAPIFVELAAATTPQELEALADRLSATPALTPLVAFDRALTS